jgi:5-methylcytosine-specific restriction endonuclease McrA
MRSGLLEPTLVLNKAWNSINVKLFKNCIPKLMKDGAKCMDEETSTLYSWEEWVETFIYDTKEDPSKQYFNCGKYFMKVPEIIVLKTYSKISNASVKISRRNLLIRDQFTCQYTGKKLPASELNIDHVVPRSSGGLTTWENVVMCDWRINSKKGSKSLQESGLSLIKQPVKPRWNPLYSKFVRRNIKESWKKFIKVDSWENYWDNELID